MNYYSRLVAQGLLRPINQFSPALMGLFTFLWGVWLLMPQWSAFESARVFRFIDSLPEWAWGATAAVVGILIVVFTALERFTPLYRSLLASNVLFGIVSWFTWWGDWQNTAGLVYMAIAMYAGYLYLNVKINYAKKEYHSHTIMLVMRIRNK